MTSSRNFSMAAPLDFPSALSFFICSISSLAAFRTPGTGRSSALSIRSTAMKQAVGVGSFTSRTLSAEAMTADSCTFSPANGRWAISSGFFCTATICCRSEGFSIFRITSGLARMSVIRTESDGRLFSFNMIVSCLGLYTMIVIHGICLFRFQQARYGGSAQLYCTMRFFRTLETVFYHWSGFL